MSGNEQTWKENGKLQEKYSEIYMTNNALLVLKQQKTEFRKSSLMLNIKCTKRKDKYKLDH